MKNKLHRFKPKSAHNIWIPLFAACLVIAAVGTLLTFLSKAESFCDITPASTVASIESAIGSCADGTTIRFPANASYALPDTIFVKDRHNLVIDGRGSTFIITTQGNTKPAQPNGNNLTGGNWMLLRGTNITLKNMTAIGSFPLAGQPINLGSESSQPGYAEWMPNYGVYGTNGAYLEDLTGKAPWGDTVTTGPDTYVDNSSPDYSSNVHIKRVHAEETSRMCFALTSGSDLWLEDSSCKNGWYGGTDEELDDPAQPMVGLHVLRNTWDGFGLFAISIPVSGSNSRDIEIRNNQILTTPALNQCGVPITMGGWPDQTTTFKNVTIANNTIPAYGTAIGLGHVAGGSITDNKITILPGGGCATGPGQFPPLIDTKDSTGVTLGNNGPDAPGANLSAAPSPTPPPPPPVPTPVPPPATPPPNSPPASCTAPANFAGIPGPNNTGQYNFTWQVAPEANEYSLHIGTVGTTPEAAYATGFTSNSATAFGLVPGQPYTFAVRSHCGNLVSANSNVLTVTAPGNATPNPCSGKALSDINCDGNTNAIDISEFRLRYKNRDPSVDFDANSSVNAIDISIFRLRYKEGT